MEKKEDGMGLCKAMKKKARFVDEDEKVLKTAERRFVK